MAKVRELGAERETVGERSEEEKKKENKEGKVCQLPSENSQVLVGLRMLITLNCDCALAAFPHSAH